MIKVLFKNKQGNKIISYTCTDGTSISLLTDNNGNMISFERFKEQYELNRTYIKGYSWVVKHIRKISEYLEEYEKLIAKELEEINKL